MDILSEVLDVLHLRAIATQSVSMGSLRGESIRPRQALAYVVLAGRCRLQVADAPIGVELFPRDAILLLGGQKHVFEPLTKRSREQDYPARLLRCAFAFERGLPHPLPQRFPDLLTLRSDFLTDQTELGRVVSLLDGELVNARLGIDFVALRLAEIVFVEILRRSQLEGHQLPFLGALSDPIVSVALACIHSQPQHPWRVAELARAAGLSRAAFSERFHRGVGEPPLRYLRAWRLLKARRHLQSTAAPIKRIAADVGYRSSTGFARAFRRLFGYPPSTVRHSASESRHRTATSG